MLTGQGFLIDSKLDFRSFFLCPLFAYLLPTVLYTTIHLHTPPFPPLSFSLSQYLLAETWEEERVALVSLFPLPRLDLAAAAAAAAGEEEDD